MRKLSKFIILCALATGMNSYAQGFSAYKLENIKAIKLFDGSQIDFKKEVSAIQFASDRENKIDFVELKQGLIIDSYDIEKVILKENTSNPFAGRAFNSDLNTNSFMLAMMGDGSGG